MCRVAMMMVFDFLVSRNFRNFEIFENLKLADRADETGVHMSI